MVSCTLMGVSWSSHYPTRGHARDAREVADRDPLAETVLLEQRLNRLLLVVAVFDHEPAAGFEVRRGAGDEGADRIEAVATPSAKCGRGLETQVSLAEVRVAARDIGRIRNDEVESPAGERRVPRAVQELDARFASQRPRVGTRDGEGLGARIRRGDAGVRPLAREGDRDRAAAGAEIENRDWIPDGAC